jgi:two-component system sensor kinase FixL
MSSKRRGAREVTAYDDALFRTLFTTAVDGIVVIDERGIVQVYNPACERLFGYAPDEVIGNNVSMLMPEPYHSQHDGYIENYLKTGNRRIIGIGREVVGRRKDGSTFPMYLSVGEDIVADGRIFVGIVHDVTEQRAHDRHIRELQQELLHVTRLTAMGQLTSALAHELNQPLTAVSNYANAARRTLAAVDTPQAQQARDMLEKAASQVTRAGEIIRRLRDFIEKRESNHTRQDINRVVSDAMALALVGTADANVKLEVHLGDGLPPLYIDKIQIEQVVVNLLRNAAEAMEHSPKRLLSVSTALRDGEFIEITIADTGPGISKEVQRRLFQPFVTTKEKGMGMGLTICRSIVEAHGGRISAGDNPGGGTVFRVQLPFARDQGEAG